MIDLLEGCEPLSRYRLPITKSRDLRLRDRGSGDRIAILRALHKAFDKGIRCGLARFGGRKKNLAQDCVATKLRIVEMDLQARLFEMHDVFAAPGRRPHQDHSAKDRGSIQ